MAQSECDIIRAKEGKPSQSDTIALIAPGIARSHYHMLAFKCPVKARRVMSKLDCVIVIMATWHEFERGRVRTKKLAAMRSSRATSGSMGNSGISVVLLV